MPQMTSEQQCRHMMLVLAELHRLGYELARIAPRWADSPGGGVWQCEIVPVTAISRHHGAIIADRLPGKDFPFYTSRHWRMPPPYICDSLQASADTMLALYPDLAAQCVGSDAEYVEWYRDLLQRTDPHGIIIAEAWQDYIERPVLDGMRVFNAGDAVKVPLPPPGKA